MSVIFCKVTNGSRFDWGAEFADVRSIVNRGQRQGMSVFEAISTALNPLQSLFPPHIPSQLSNYKKSKG